MTLFENWTMVLKPEQLWVCSTTVLPEVCPTHSIFSILKSLSFFRQTASRLDLSILQVVQASPATREQQVGKVEVAANLHLPHATERWKVRLARESWRGGWVACCGQWSGALPLCGYIDYRSCPAPPYQLPWQLYQSSDAESAPLPEALWGSEGRVWWLQVCCDSSKFLL